jgi:Tol biopolymer transport system component
MRLHDHPHTYVFAIVAFAILLTGCGGSEDRLDLSGDPPLVVVWGDAARANSQAAGDIYVVKPDTAATRLVRRWSGVLRDDHPYGAFNALWSPGRDSIAFSLGVYNNDPGSRVAIIRSDGGNLNELTGGYYRMLVAWTPDGKRLIHRSFWNTHPFGSLSPISGDNERVRLAGAGQLREFAWSSDGSRIVAALSDRGLFTMNPDGRKLTHITHGDDSDPHWSPDGEEILFTRSTCVEDDIECESNVYVVNAGGSELHALTDAPYTSAVGWSPDGKKILFLREALEGETGASVELWAMNANGGQETRLPFNRPGRSVVAADWGR